MRGGIMGFIVAGALMVNACVGAGMGFMVAVFHATGFHPAVLAVLDMLACASGIFLIGFIAWLLYPAFGSSHAVWSSVPAVVAFALAWAFSRRMLENHVSDHARSPHQP